MAKSKIFLYFCLSFAGGIFLNSVISISQLILLGFLILGIIFISAFWKYKKFVVLGFCFLLLVFGVFWHQRSLNQISQSQLQDYNLAGETIEFTGQVVAEPDVREKSTKLTIQPEGMEGKVLVTVNRYLGYQYGDRIKVKGKLEAPYVFEEFNYKEYLAKEGIYSVVYFPEIELIENNQGNFLLASIFKLKDKLRENIDQNLSLPQSSILAAVILGDKRQISDDWKEKLNLAGVRHLTAVSGMHVSILTALLMSLLIGLGFWKRQAFFLTIGLIGLYVLLTGLQPSAVRAGIMGSFFLLANFLGRGNISSRTLVLAAVLMLLQNPLLLKWDVGFQLSFWR